MAHIGAVLGLSWPILGPSWHHFGRTCEEQARTEKRRTGAMQDFRVRLNCFVMFAFMFPVFVRVVSYHLSVPACLFSCMFCYFSLSFGETLGDPKNVPKSTPNPKGVWEKSVLFSILWSVGPKMAPRPSQERSWGGSWVVLGGSWAALGGSWALFGGSWEAFGPS